MPKKVKNSLLIIIACFLTFLWSKNQYLREFSLQLSAVLFLFFLLERRFLKRTSLFILSEAVFFTILIVLLILDTGGLSSPLFFLVYFLLFSLSLLLEPQTAFILSLTLIILFLATLEKIESFGSIIPLFSLPFITPLAVFFGHEHQKLEKTEKELAHDEKQTLLWLTTTFREHLHNISDALQNIKEDNLTEQQRESLNTINHNERRLEKLGEKLKNTVEGELKE